MKKATVINCLECQADYEPRKFLANCDVSWPNQRWLSFTCPECGKSAYVQVGKGRLGIGDLDGPPGPCFMEEKAFDVPGLTFPASDAGVTVRWRRFTRRVPARK
jgi:predicted RNA-binding Zn-ribbon protein involved in translation (DUF1610 family)